MLPDAVGVFALASVSLSSSLLPLSGWLWPSSTSALLCITTAGTRSGRPSPTTSRNRVERRSCVGRSSNRDGKPPRAAAVTAAVSLFASSSSLLCTALELLACDGRAPTTGPAAAAVVGSTSLACMLVLSRDIAGLLALFPLGHSDIIVATVALSTAETRESSLTSSLRGRMPIT